MDAFTKDNTRHNLPIIASERQKRNLQLIMWEKGLTQQEALIEALEAYITRQTLLIKQRKRRYY